MSDPTESILVLIAARLALEPALECTVSFAECTPEYVIVRARAAPDSAVPDRGALDLVHRPPRLVDDSGVEYAPITALTGSGVLRGVVDWVYCRPSTTEAPLGLRLRGHSWSVRFAFPEPPAV